MGLLTWSTQHDPRPRSPCNHHPPTHEPVSSSARHPQPTHTPSNRPVNQSTQSQFLSRFPRGRRPTGPSTPTGNPDLPAPEKALRILRTPELAQGWPSLPFESPGRYISRPDHSERRKAAPRCSGEAQKAHPLPAKPEKALADAPWTHQDPSAPPRPAPGLPLRRTRLRASWTPLRRSHQAVTTRNGFAAPAEKALRVRVQPPLLRHLREKAQPLSDAPEAGVITHHEKALCLMSLTSRGRRGASGKGARCWRVC